MTAYLLRRLLSLSLSLVAASLVIFLVMEVVPGDPASFMMGINADPQAVAALRTQLGLDEPEALQQARGQAARGDRFYVQVVDGVACLDQVTETVEHLVLEEIDLRPAIGRLLLLAHAGGGVDDHEQEHDCAEAAGHRIEERETEDVEGAARHGSGRHRQ